jgi:Family of unknown function (DUF5677)
MDETTNQRVVNLVTQIKNLNPELNELSKYFREGIYSEDTYKFNKYSGDDWRRNAFGNALVRLRIFTEQNFQFVETMGLVAVARYIFELSVWLHLLNKDSNYGLLYYRNLMDTQLRFYQDSLNHHKREVDLLKSFEEKDKHFSQLTVDKILFDKSSNAEKVKDLFAKSMQDVDEEASRKFSLYLDDAKINGYGFQAHLVEKKAIPTIKETINVIEKEIKRFNNSLSKKQKKIFPKQWRWRQMADKVGLLTEYDYIYCYASKLLHATPASLTTDQKNLEFKEVYLYMRYIYSKLHEIIELSRKQPETLMNTEAEQLH